MYSAPSCENFSFCVAFQACPVNVFDISYYIFKVPSEQLSLPPSVTISLPKKCSIVKSDKKTGDLMLTMTVPKNLTVKLKHTSTVLTLYFIQLLI